MEVPVRVGAQQVRGVRMTREQLSATIPAPMSGRMIRARTGQPAPRRRAQSLFACFGT